MAEDLIDAFWIFVNPVLLGEGIRLLERVPGHLKLARRENRALSSGVICLHYERIRED